MRLQTLCFLLFTSLTCFAQSPGVIIEDTRIHYQLDVIPEPLPPVYFDQPGWYSGANEKGDFEITESFIANGLSVLIADGPIYARRDSGFVGIGYSFTGEPDADLHVFQRNFGPFAKRGLRLDNGTSTWNIYTNAASNLSFVDDDGDLRAYITDGAGSFVITSDKRLKENFLAPSSVMAKIQRLKPTWYNYKKKDEKVLGFVAQDVEKVFPEFVHTAPSGIKGINYNSFGPLAIKALQEQQAVIENLQERILKLEAHEN